MKTPTQNQRAHLALLATAFIWGLNYTISKYLLTGIFTPLQLIFLRLLGGMICFYIFQKLFVHEKVARKDLIMLAFLGIIGFGLNQTLFYAGLAFTSPVDASILHVINPILVLIFSSLLIGEKVTFRKTGGILLGSSGALLLIFYSSGVSFSGNHALGNLMIILNMLCYALYLVLIKQLTGKYKTATILKWVSLFGFIFIIPFSIKPALQIHYSAISLNTWLWVLYVILMNTFMAYFLVNYALERVMPSVVSYYTYLQPFIAAAASVTVGSGTITWTKILAASLIFSGVALVNSGSKKEQSIESNPARD
ncbi:MAG: EamA family transporter [Bacteroidetes bacterium]|nr:EamA family transporter [Bacteroidota bacterium]